MRNLELHNIFQDRGQVQREVVNELETMFNVKFQTMYKEFIVLHNCADLNADVFDYYNTEKQKNTSDSFAFLNVHQIQEDIDSLLKQSTDDPNDSDVFKFYKYFDKKLIPFGETGGGDFICFDYRNHDGDNPPIVLWIHDIPEKRISFIANNFEEFINMLHEPED